MKILLTLAVTFYTGVLAAQNLVPNPSFEQYTQCPSGGDLVAYCTHWWDWIQSPDYFNVCAAETEVGIPSNQFGNQSPSSGTGYIGLFTYYSNKESYREVAVTQLNNPLEVGQIYYASFKISPTLMIDTNSGIAHLFSNNIGLKFFQEINDTSLSFLEFTNNADLYLEEVITDTSNWFNISGTFEATETFSYLAIGNFFSNELTDTLHTNSSNNFAAYFYVDDVCVSMNPLDCGATGLEGSSLDETFLFPNPANDVLHIKSMNSNLLDQFELYDSWGRQILLPSKKDSADGIDIDCGTLINGCYYIKIQSEDSVFTRQIIIQH
ncbi:MAG: T9SS type A sorting domain-containing protein [Flavobacteriales bacterium]